MKIAAAAPPTTQNPPIHIWCVNNESVYNLLYMDKEASHTYGELQQYLMNLT
jgi:hypothetical protein